MTIPCDTLKRREIVFHPTPPGQIERALPLLAGLPDLEVRRVTEATLEVRYCIADFSLEGLETALSEQGFHLENTLLMRLVRALIYHVERVQRENMGKPEVMTKNYQAYMEAWARRPHGDHDETPEVWRQYK
jgi:hypothetical protein